MPQHCVCMHLTPPRAAVKVSKVVAKAEPAGACDAPVDMEHFVVGSRPLPKGFVCPPPGQAIMDEAAVKQQEKLFLKTRALRLLQQQKVERRKKVEYLEDMIQKCNTIYDLMGDWLKESESAKPQTEETEFIKLCVLYVFFLSSFLSSFLSFFLSSFFLLSFFIYLLFH